MVREKDYSPDYNRDIGRTREAVQAATSQTRGQKRPISPVRKDRKIVASKPRKSTHQSASSSSWNEAEWEYDRNESYGNEWEEAAWDYDDRYDSYADQSYIETSWNQHRFDCLMDQHAIDEVGRNSLHTLMLQGWPPTEFRLYSEYHNGLRQPLRYNALAFLIC